MNHGLLAGRFLGTFGSLAVVGVAWVLYLPSLSRFLLYLTRHFSADDKVR